MKLVFQNFGIKHKTISPYHSQSQGLVERFNRTLNSCLKKRSIEEKKNWEQYLPATAFAYRSIKQATTGQSPFYLLYGYEPNTYFHNTMTPIDAKEPSFEFRDTAKNAYCRADTTTKQNKTRYFKKNTTPKKRMKTIV